MWLIREIKGEVEEHYHRFRVKKSGSIFGGPEYEKVPETKPYIILKLSDNKFTYGQHQFYVGEWNNIRQQATSIPVKLWRSTFEGTEEETFLYIYKDRYYLTEISMAPDDVLLTLKSMWQSKKDKLSRELDRIKAKAEFEGGIRTPIPEDVQILVWNRDGGKCAKCGRTENLEFDHIIPLSKGGSNSARNIQLLCEHCNRSKGANIGG